MKDNNDPRYLYEAMAKRKEIIGCTLAQAADFLYADMAKRGYTLGRPAALSDSVTVTTETVVPTGIDPPQAPAQRASGRPLGWL